MSCSIKKRPDLVTTGIAAHVCGVAPRTISKWCDSGRLPSYRLPGSLDRRIVLEDLRRFMHEAGIPTDYLDGYLGRVLLVTEDDRLSLQLHHHLPVGWCVDAAACWFEAGTLAQARLPTAFVVDLACGRALASTVRCWLEAKAGGPLPCVALSTEDDPRAVEFARRGWLVFRPPVDPKALAQVVQAPLSKNGKHS